MSALEYRLASLLLRVLGAVFSLRPIVRDRIVLASPRLAHLDGNLRYLRDALARLRPDLRPIVLVEPYGYGWLDKVTYLLRAVRGMYFLRTARVFVVDNSYLPIHVGPHRRGTRVVQLWHAVSAVKRFGLDTATPLAEPERTFLHRYYDAVVVSSEAVRDVYAAGLRTPRERVIALGTPRTDFFFDPAAVAAARSRLLREHPALVGRRIVLYAPTLRGRGRDKRSAGDLDAARLRALLPAEYALVLKGHPNVDPGSVPTAGFDVVVSPRAEMNELLALADVLVTDYSSAVFEFALLRRPMVLLVGDLEAYARDPGIAVDFDRSMVGTRAADTDAVARAILDGAFDLSSYDAFIEHHLGACDGHAGDRVAELVVGYLEAEDA